MTAANESLQISCYLYQDLNGPLPLLVAHGGVLWRVSQNAINVILIE